MSEKVEEYRTCDMYQAAALMSSGCKMERFTVDRNRVYFHLNNNAGLVSNLIKDLLAHKLDVDALTLIDNVRSLKSLCGEVIGNLRS